MPVRLRPEEEFARQAIRAELDVEVEPHDDGSSPAMFDLVIRYPNGRVGAVEVTAAVDAASVQLWRLVSSRQDRWIVPKLLGGWMVGLKPSARAKRILEELPELLYVLEQTGVHGVKEPEWPRFSSSNERYAQSLGVVWARQGDTSFPGSIYLTIDQEFDRTSGVIPSVADPVVDWVGNYLARADRRDVVSKLSASGATERHAFVIVPGFAEAPFDVVLSLVEPGVGLPERAPFLPECVTHVWLASTWSGSRGLRWSPASEWSWFTARAA